LPFYTQSIALFIDKEQRRVDYLRSEWKHRERCKRSTRLSPQFNNENSHELAQQYLSTFFEQGHQRVFQFVPSVIKNPFARILNIVLPEINSDGLSEAFPYF